MQCGVLSAAGVAGGAKFMSFRIHMLLVLQHDLCTAAASREVATDVAALKLAALRPQTTPISTA